MFSEGTKLKVSKLLATLATAAMIITGISPIMAQAAGAPYTYTAFKTDLSAASGELVASANRVFWKTGAELWSSDGTASTKAYTFGSAQDFTLTQSTPQYTEGGFWDNSYYIHRSVFVGDVMYFWGATASNDWDIWKSNGTSASRVTTLHLPYNLQNSGTNPPSLWANGTDIYFWAYRSDNTGQYQDLRKLNTVTGAQALVPNAPTVTMCNNQSVNGSQYAFAVVNGKLVFSYNVSCLEKVGSINLTSGAFTDIQPSTLAPGETVSMVTPSEFSVMNNKIYYMGDILSSGNPYTSNSELYATDGATVTRVTTLGGGGNYGVGQATFPLMRPTVVGNELYFAGFNSATGDTNLYKTTGTGAPTLVSTTSGLGKRTNVSAQVLSVAGTPQLITDILGSTNHQLMASINTSTGASTELAPNLAPDQDALGIYNQPWAATDYTTPITWDGKAWWLAREYNSNTSSYVHNFYYTDGTAGGTTKLTFFPNDAAYVPGYQGSSKSDQFADYTTNPIVATSNALWFLRQKTDPNDPGPEAILYKVTSNSSTPTPTPTPTPLVCGSVMSKLKVEAESASALSPAFAAATCEYTMTVDNKTTKVDFTPTFTGASANVKVAGTSVNAALKSTKTQSVTLGAAGTTTQVDFVIGSNTYRVNVVRSAAPAPGAKDAQFTAPSLNGAVVSVDKDNKKETNQNGDKKDAEVTYIAGSFTGKVAKLDDKGKKDEEFSANVPAIAGTVSTVKVDEQHRVLVAGENVDGNKDVVRLKPDGSKDTSFSGPDLGAGKKVDDIEVQKDGKIVIVGDFGDGKNAKKLKDNGSEDESFKNNLPSISGEIKTAKIQEDGKILLGGSFNNAGGDSDNDKIVRVEKDGRIDSSFKPAANGAHFNDDVEDIETQKDGKIVVVGKSEKTSNDEADKVVRLNKDGHEDSSFVFDGNIPSGKKVEAVKVKDSGEVYIAGDFEDVGDSDGDKIAKVKKDGHVDTDWNPNPQGGNVHDLELEKHGKVFVAGEGAGDADRVDKVHEDGDRDGDKPRYDSIDDDRASNKVDTGVKGQTHIHGDGFKDGTTVTIGGKPATVVKIDDRDEDITIQVPAPDNDHKGDSTHERKPADIVIHVPNGQGGTDDIEIKEGFGYTDKKEAQRILPINDSHINSDKDDEDHKGKVHDDEALAAYIPSDDPITHVSKTPDVCTVDENGRVHYEHRGDCKIVTDAPGDMGHEDPAPVTEVIPVAGLDPQLVAPSLPDWAGDPAVPEVPETGFQLPAPTSDDPSIPVVYTPTTPDACDVTVDGLVTPIDPTAACTVQITTPGTNLYEPTAPADPPVTVTIPAIAWIPPVAQNGVITDPDVPAVVMPSIGGTVKLGTDLAFKYDKAKGTLTPTAWGIYFGPIQATINYSWTNTNPSTQAVTTGSGSCVVKWGVLKKWSSLSKADQKKYKKPLGAKVFTTTGNCKVNAAAKAALAKPGTAFTATSDVLRTRMWPATYKPEKPIIPNVRPNPVPIAPRLRHYSLTISTQ